MIEKFLQHEVTNCLKLAFLSSFKCEYKIKPYLFFIKKTQTVRKTFNQFRIRIHKLEIEYGRQQNTTNEERKKRVESN